MNKILITGASGLIGSELSDFLLQKNYEIVKLVRTKNNIPNIFLWDIEKSFIENGALENIDYVIHLSGAGIGDKRWTEKRKKEIIDSRIKSTELLFNSFSKMKIKPKAIISASAVGYYGAITSDKTFNEDDPPANDFLGNVCKLWEDSVNKFDELGMRTVKLRLGVILSNNGGALKKMLLPVKLGMSSGLGNGNQYMPWIHIQDVLSIFLHCIENENINGAYNVTAPFSVTNKIFIKNLAQVFNKPFFMPNVPSFIMKLLFGEMSNIILYGSKVSSQKIIDAGYKFKFPELGMALLDLFKK